MMAALKSIVAFMFIEISILRWQCDCASTSLARTLLSSEGHAGKSAHPHMLVLDMLPTNIKKQYRAIRTLLSLGDDPIVMDYFKSLSGEQLAFLLDTLQRRNPASISGLLDLSAQHSNDQQKVAMSQLLKQTLQIMLNDEQLKQLEDDQCSKVDHRRVKGRGTGGASGTYRLPLSFGSIEAMFDTRSTMCLDLREEHYQIIGLKRLAEQSDFEGTDMLLTAFGPGLEKALTSARSERTLVLEWGRGHKDPTEGMYKSNPKQFDSLADVYADLVVKSISLKTLTDNGHVTYQEKLRYIKSVTEKYPSKVIADFPTLKEIVRLEMMLPDSQENSFEITSFLVRHYDIPKTRVESARSEIRKDDERKKAEQFDAFNRNVLN